MTPLRSKPVCPKCSKQHWNFVACDTAATRNQAEERNEQKRRNYLINQPRDGYTDWGHRLDPDTVLFGSTFGLKREPGLQHGSFRD